MEEKFKISVLNFIPHYKKVEVGKYKDGAPAYLGDCVEHNNESDWFIVYRYGEILIKQIGMWSMIGKEGFKTGDFSGVEKTNIVGAGSDWLIIGYKNEPMYEVLKTIVKEIE